MVIGVWSGEEGFVDLWTCTIGIGGMGGLYTYVFGLEGIGLDWIVCLSLCLSGMIG